eukprot:1151958-Pelagomonas_calceolata.AAC.2
MHANELVTTRRAIENKHTSHSQILEPGASINPPGPHYNSLFYNFVVCVVRHRISIPASSPMRQPALPPRYGDLGLGWSIVLLLMGPITDPESGSVFSVSNTGSREVRRSDDCICPCIMLLGLADAADSDFSPHDHQACRELEDLWQTMLEATASEQRQQNDKVEIVGGSDHAGEFPAAAAATAPGAAAAAAAARYCRFGLAGINGTACAGLIWNAVLLTPSASPLSTAC